MQKRLSDRVADDILMMIMIEKRFLPGEKLPNEIDLSEELKISRTTLREAVRILAANGVVEIRLRPILQMERTGQMRREISTNQLWNF